MMKKERNLRFVVTGILLLAIVAAGVGLYRSANDSTHEDQTELQHGELAQQETLEEDTEEVPESEDVTTPNVEAQMEDVKEESIEESEPVEVTEETTTDVVEEVLPALDFTENTVMNWPIQGDVLIDYSMDGAVYFPTLEVYKYHPAVVLSAQENQEVQATANGKVIDITENEETGITLTMDLGNGYQASYGQLQNLSVEKNQIVAAGTVIGTVATPTKYYAEEGANLYFAMTKDGTAIDPILYMETGEE